MVKNTLCNAENAGLIPGEVTKIPHASEQLSLNSATRESACHNLHPRQPNKLIFKIFLKELDDPGRKSLTSRIPFLLSSLRLWVIVFSNPGEDS